MGHNEEYIEIDLREMLFYVLRRWKSVLAAGLVLAVLLGGAKAALEYKTMTDPEEQQKLEEDLRRYDVQLRQYEELIEKNKEKIDAQQEYIDRAVLMKADWRNVYVAKATYYVDSGYQILPGNNYQDTDKTALLAWHYRNNLYDYLICKEFIEKTGMEAEFLKDLISIQIPANNTISLTVKHPSESSAKAIMEDLQAQMEEIHGLLNETVKEHTLALVLDTCNGQVDEGLKAYQQAVYDDLQSYEEELLEYEKKLRELEGNAPDGLNPIVKWAILGGLVGCVLMVGVYAFMMIAGGRVCAPDEVGRRYKIPMLGMACIGEKKPDRITGLLRRLNGRLESNSEENNCYLAENLENRRGGAGKIVVFGDVEQAAAVVGEILRNKLPHLELQYAASPLKDAAALRSLADCEGAVLVVAAERSRVGDIGRIVDLVKDYGKTIIGYVFSE